MAAGTEGKVATEKLYRTLLSWNYADVTNNLDGSGIIQELRKVPTSFSSVEEYINTFAPLVLEECTALLRRGHDESQTSEAHQAVVASAKESDGYLSVRLVLPPGANESFSGDDIVLISKDPPTDEQMNLQLHALGMVEAREGEQSVSVRFNLLHDPHHGDVQELQRVKAMRAGLQKLESCWYLLDLANLATITREWNALHAAGSILFKDILLSAKPNPSSVAKHALKAPEAMQEAMAQDYNPSQMQALTSGLDGREVILIQGPPGTGKTRTLLGLLSMILHAAPEGTYGLRKIVQNPKGPLSSEERHRLWLRASPWLTGAPNPRDLVKPWEEGSIADVFGLLDVVKPVVLGREQGPKAHVLVCAPSNSALDEIVLRLLAAGVMDKKGQRYTPSIVRVGLQVHHSVQAVALDTLVDHRMAMMASAKGTSGKSTTSRADRAQRERIKTAVIEEAHVVCSTLAFSGSSIFSRLSRQFDVVVIDEAAQAVEPSTLVPLVTGARQVFLVGDPIQLPATVLSNRAVEYNYAVSLFKRLQMAGYPVHMLDTQYRMHPSISAFPSQAFYQSNLKDGPGVAENTARPWHAHKCLGPLAFYDVAGEEQYASATSYSLVNFVEVELVFSLYTALVQRYPQLKSSANIGVISPYKAQVRLLREKFKAALGDEGARLVDINTIDGFQGREKEVVIFSAVRSKTAGHIGFVADERRLNVGLTRARTSLLVIGNSNALKADKRWSLLLRHCRSQRCLYQPAKPFSDYLAKVIAGAIEPLGPTPQDLQDVEDEERILRKAAEPQAEPGAYDDDVDYSDDEAPRSAAPPVSRKQVKPPKSTAPPPAKKGRTSRAKR